MGNEGMRNGGLDWCCCCCCVAVVGMCAMLEWGNGDLNGVAVAVVLLLWTCVRCGNGGMGLDWRWCCCCRCGHLSYVGLLQIHCQIAFLPAGQLSKQHSSFSLHTFNLKHHRYHHHHDRHHCLWSLLCSQTPQSREHHHANCLLFFVCPHQVPHPLASRPHCAVGPRPGLRRRSDDPQPILPGATTVSHRCG